ncbi:hypothetical protein SH449x_002770 [Pirellulaceae bacterium SH449]
MANRDPLRSALESLRATRRNQRLEADKFYIVDFHFVPSPDSDAVKVFAREFLALSLEARLACPIYGTKELDLMLSTGELSVFVEGHLPEYKPFTAYISATAVEYGFLVSTCRKIASHSCIKDVCINGSTVFEDAN